MMAEPVFDMWVRIRNKMEDMGYSAKLEWESGFCVYVFDKEEKIVAETILFCGDACLEDLKKKLI